jgi:acyl phosphate:glycerol-3-phosphate acyltransferase
VILLSVTVFLLSYLLGSIPNGYIAGRLAGVDVRKHGSGNIGATNVLRTLGKAFGFTVFLADTLKGFLAVQVSALCVAQVPTAHQYADWFVILAAITCVLGHAFPIWLRFKGGKGVATSAGVMLGLSPAATLFAVLVWVVVFESTRYVSVASVTAAFALPIAIAVLLKLHFAKSMPILGSAIVLAIVVCWRHRSNFTRLMQGTEKRFTRR